MLHSFQLNGYNIVMDVNSGAVHVVDGMVYDMIQLLDADFLARSFDSSFTEKLEQAYPAQLFAPLEARFARSQLEEGYEEIYEMYQNGQLFTSDDYEQFADMMVSAPIKAMCLNVAHDCNLRCSYCFASTGDFGGERKLMTAETGKKAIDYLLKYSGDRHNLEMDFFGGEPLMAFDVVKEVVDYARSKEKKYNKNFRFTITTNGVLLDDEVIDFCNREMHNVVLSLDGRKEVHDRFRKDYAGKGSYDTIVPKFQRFVEKRGDKSYYMRGTYTHYNTDFTNDIFHMADLGFTELSMEPVVCAPGDPAELTAEDLDTVKEQYELLAKDMLRREREGRPITFYHYMLDLTSGPCVYKRISGCGSGTEYMAVTPWGDLYPCHQFVGEEAYKLGDVWNGVTNTALREEFRACNAYARPDCADCWAKLYCSGGCAANAYHATGSIRGVYEAGCELFKKRIECAIMMKVAESQEQD